MCCCFCPDFSPRWDAAWWPMQHCNNSHQHTALQGERPFHIFQEFVFFAEKQVRSGRETHWCAMHVFCFVYFPVTAPYKSYLGMWHRIYTCGTTFSFFRISLRHPKGSFSIPIKAESNQSTFYQQHQTLLRVFFKLEALIASLGLISWSVGLCKQQTVFMFAVT